MTAFKKITIILMLLLLSTGVFIQGTAGCSSIEEDSKLIVLLTDFGNDDYRVPQLKGIIYTNYSDAEVIDGSHGIPAFDISTGAFFLDKAAKAFPEETVFICIVAPYNQSEMRYIVITNDNNQIFVLPDNGLATYILDDIDNYKIYNVTNQDLFDEAIAEMAAEPLQGRLGALIASGYNPQNFGDELDSPRILDIQEPSYDGKTLKGSIICVDHFGNYITNISGETVEGFGLTKGDTITIKSPSKTINSTYGTIYSDVVEGNEIAFVNTNLNLLQLSLNLGDFDAKYDIGTGVKIEIDK